MSSKHPTRSSEASSSPALLGSGLGNREPRTRTTPEGVALGSVIGQWSRTWDMQLSDKRRGFG